MINWRRRRQSTAGNDAHCRGRNDGGQQKQEVDDEDGQALDAHFEILNLISKLGGDTRQYRRERAAEKE